jgi:tetratricopeptide (TPR) repeat protein
LQGTGAASVSDDSDFEKADASPSGELAAHLAMSGAATDEAREYLRKQSRLADLQIDTLEKKDEFELSHLRFRRFSDYARFALEIAGFLVVLLIVCGLGSMVWNASRDHGLLVDAFSVPPDLAQTGLTGSVVANRLIDRYGELQTNSFSVTQGGESFRREGNDEVHVEIPDTGVSLGELQRYLRDWLGNDTHVSGEVVRMAKGYSLTVRYGDQPGATEDGPDLDALLSKSAEHLMQRALPYRYVEYLARHGRGAEALTFLPALSSNGTPLNRGRAYAAWATIYFYNDNMRRSGQISSEGLKIDPDNPLLLAFLSAAEGNQGHDEQQEHDAAAAVSNFKGSAIDDLDPSVKAVIPILFTIYAEEAAGDFRAAIAGWSHLAEFGGAYDPEDHTADASLDHDLALARRAGSANSPTFQGKPNFNVPESRMLIAYFQGDWAEAVRDANDTARMLKFNPQQAWQLQVGIVPYWASALAKKGDVPGAREMIGKTSLDCDACVRARGRIAAVAHDWDAAAHWFAMVSARSPHVPLADTDWGAMLMAKGDLDGAIAKFERADAIGPHFADPLEMWGEALMAKNRSDQALAKFAEADKYAPNWGRLHLKWGEALWWFGDKDGARKQFAAASSLDLSQADRVELARMEAVKA